MITEKEFKERCAEILRKEITFSHQVGDYVIHGALDSLWKLHIEQNSHKHGVSGKQPDPGIIQAAANDYVDNHVTILDQEKEMAREDFTAGAYWAFSQVACATAKGGPAED